MPKFIDLTGKKFGKVSVLKFSHMNKNHKSCFLCKCDCGKEFVTIGASLVSGNTVSCGCLKKEIWLKERTKHGLCKNRLYTIWGNMIQRSTNKKNPEYKNYGNRGIYVCKNWRESFKSFYDWSILNGYKKGLTIDRIDYNGNYCPENCRWATLKQQARNKRNNHTVLYKGEKHCIAEWAEILNVTIGAIKYRVKKNLPLEKKG